MDGFKGGGEMQTPLPSIFVPHFFKVFQDFFLTAVKMV